MRRKLYKILVTGGAGFIGSAFVRLLLNEDCPRIERKKSKPRGVSLNKVIVVDKLTYAGDLARLKEADGKYRFNKTDICDKIKIEAIFKEENPEIVVHFAAETHVDRSIDNASPFIETNIKGTQILLDASRKYKVKKFIHISTDEVYGEIRNGSFREDFSLNPNSPYSASKAAADLLIKSYIRTYNFPAVIVRPSNNYGPWQYPEKLIPVIINNAIQNKKVPVYANGLNVREWLYVSDCAQAILFLLNKSGIGETYNIGSSHQEKNIDVVKKVLKIMGKPLALIRFVKDRPGHDLRYALDSSKIRKLGWRPKTSFACGIKNTVAWNVANCRWLNDKFRIYSKNGCKISGKEDSE